MMLQEVLQSAVDGHWLTPARVGPMRTAVKQFSAMFGAPPEQLGPEQYHLPKEALFRFIEQHSALDISPSKLRNTKNNIHWLLTRAVRETWLRPTAGDILTWQTRHKMAHTHQHRTRIDGSRCDQNLYGLVAPSAEPTSGGVPRLRLYYEMRRNGCALAPQAFLGEIDAYLDWCQKPYATDRDAKIRKRAITAKVHRSILLRIGGYAHHIAGIPLDEMTLERLTQPDVVRGFADWWVNTRRGRVTRSIQDYIQTVQVIARHWLKDTPRADTLKTITAALGNDQGPVWDKEASLIPLRMLEEVGVRNYPFSAERLQRSRYLRTVYRHVQDPRQVPMPRDRERSKHPCHWIAHEVMMSLIIRLLVRLPMRQRCIREMRLGHNLKPLPDGHWEVHFRGIELKVASRKSSGINEYRHPVPPELTGLINEWVTVWRPLRLPEQGSDLVFLTQKGRQYDHNMLNESFLRVVYRFTGIRTSIHMIRDAWASDYLDATGDVSGCADMLGDTVQMVLTHYAHVLKRRAHGRTASWLQTHLNSAG